MTIDWFATTIRFGMLLVLAGASYRIGGIWPAVQVCTAVWLLLPESGTE